MPQDREKAINLAHGKDIRDIKRKDKIPLKELTREQLQFKKDALWNHLAELEQCLHYAKQDVAAFFGSMNISNPEKRREAERALAELEKEFELGRKELSDLNALL